MKEILVTATGHGVQLEHGYGKPGPTDDGRVVYVITEVPDDLPSSEVVAKLTGKPLPFGRYEIPYAEL